MRIKLRALWTAFLKAMTPIAVATVATASTINDTISNVISFFLYDPRIRGKPHRGQRKQRDGPLRSQSGRCRRAGRPPAGVRGVLALSFLLSRRLRRHIKKEKEVLRGHPAPRQEGSPPSCTSHFTAQRTDHLLYFAQMGTSQAPIKNNIGNKCALYNYLVNRRTHT